LLATVAILIPAVSRQTGTVLCIFLLLIRPSNFYAAFQRVDFGGHAAGPSYLLVDPTPILSHRMDLLVCNQIDERVYVLRFFEDARFWPLCNIGGLTGLPVAG
jgi:hypothetical protein